MKVRDCHTIRVENEDGTVTFETEERWIELPGVLTPEQAVEIDRLQRGDDARAERNARLAACDWTTVADVPLSDEKREAWKAYRQALRDVTGQAGFPDAIEWPGKP